MGLLSENVPRLCEPAPEACPRVLVAEDDRMMARLVEAAMRRLEVEVRGSADGEAALVLARSWRPHVLILDINLPRRSGLEVLRRLRREAAGAQPTVLVVSAHTQIEVAERAFEAGADDYIVKPVDLRVLIERVRSLLPGPGARA